jgi:bifunctional enzyme CysN/CysC/sulfate adenylyltransferase subunit 1
MATVVPVGTVNALDLFLEQEWNKELLRFTTAGSVDDGKSTLIGRLLYDSKSVYEDQLDSVKNSRINRSGRAIDFSLLTDGLRAEREQGITIDVAYRFFSTPRRKFIIADTPGHEQYTRNMATGASTADLAVILIDASKGLLPQTRRHAYIASLLGITHVLAAVNKMDLVAFDEDVFVRLQDDFSELAVALGIRSIECVPISALDGDNVVTRSERTPWYGGPTLLEHLETVPLRVSGESADWRFPVQSVIRPDARFRGFAGRVASGTLRPGDEVLALPSKQKTHVESILSFDGNLQAAGPGQSVVLKLGSEIDLSRGDLLVSPNRPPHISKRFAAMVVWLHETPLELYRSYLAKHTGRQVKVKATRISYRVDVNQLTEHPANRLEMNEIASVEFEASQALYFDPYSHNRTTGSLVLIDPLSNATVGAVMICEELAPEARNRDRTVSGRPAETRAKVALEERIRRHGHPPAIVVLTGERTAAESLERELWAQGLETALIDRGEMRNSESRAYLTGLWNLGLVVISWAETSIRLGDKKLYAEIAGESLFDLSSAQVPDKAGMDGSEVLRIARSLGSGGSRTPEGEN